jgi:hypothetical protein
MIGDVGHVGDPEESVLSDALNMLEVPDTLEA